MSAERVLVLGNLKGTARSAVESACNSIGALPHLVSRTDAALATLPSGRWRAVLVDMTTPGASRFCQGVRSDRYRFLVPMLGLSPQLADLAFTNAYRWGADDVVPLSNANALTTRLAACRAQELPRTSPQGRALLLDSDEGRRHVTGRALACAGYDLVHAATVIEGRNRLAEMAVKLVVLCAEQPADLEPFAPEIKRRSDIDWVVLAKQRDLLTVRERLANSPNTIAISSHDPPENVLFALNLLHVSGEGTRQGMRALHGGTVLFRAIGDDHDECGFTYSVSSRGVFVRTLSPPPADRVWLEMHPPSAERRIRVAGRVAWSKRFGMRSSDNAPAGFGVELLDGLGDDMQLWRQGIETLQLKAPETERVPPLPLSQSAPFRIPLPTKHPTPSVSSLGSRPPAESTRSGAAARMSALSGAPSVPPNGNDAGLQNDAPVAPENDRPTLVRARRIGSMTATAPGTGTGASPSAPPPSFSTEKLVARSIIPVAKPEAAAKRELVSDPAPVFDSPSESAIPLRREVKAPLPTAPESEQSPLSVAPVTPHALSSRPPRPPIAADAPGVTFESIASAPAQRRTEEAAGIFRELTQAAAAATARQSDTAESETTPVESPNRRPEWALALDDASHGPLEPDVPGPPSVPSAPSPRGKDVRLWVGLLVCGVAGALLWTLLQGQTSPSVTASQAVAESHPAPSARPTEGKPSSSTSRGPRPSPGPAATAVRALTSPAAAAQNPSATAGADTSPASPPTQPPAPSASSLPDPNALPDDYGWLKVSSKLSSQVFVHGKAVGQTNQWLRVHCGPRFIRLGSAPGEWLSDGVPAKIGCRAHTQLALEN